MVIQPGDSLNVIKDFKDIGNTSFYGDRADLNQQISKFRGKYLGRYPTDYTLPYLDFKNDCEKEKANNYQILNEFQENNSCTNEFKDWAAKQIELDYCNALFHYPFQHFIRSKVELTDSSAYFSFIKNLEDKFDNSVVMSDYFRITEQYMLYQVIKNKEYQQKMAKKDKVVDLIIEDLFSSTKNNYLAQFTLGSYLNTFLKANTTERIDANRNSINAKINDFFLRNNLQEHYDRVTEFNKNPKRFSDAILGSDESNTGISFQPFNGENVVKELIEANPGKVIYVDFWAISCGPCLASMQSSKQLIADFKNKDVAFVFICISSRGDLWVEKLKELKIGGQHLFCNFEETKAIRQRFNFNGVPYYLLINKKGVIVDFGLHLDPRSEYAKMQIEKLLNE